MLKRHTTHQHPKLKAKEYKCLQQSFKTGFISGDP